MLEGLRYRQALLGDCEGPAALRRPAEEYLLSRQLLYRHSTGEPVGGWVAEFGYPFRWPYDALSALDYFRRASGLDGSAPDARLAAAVELIRSKRQSDGTWLQDVHHAGQEWFAVDVPVGESSPWLTLYAARVLRWWDESSREER